MRPTAYPPKKNVPIPSTKASTAAWFISASVHLFEDFDAVPQPTDLRLWLRGDPHDARSNQLPRRPCRDLRNAASGEPSHFGDREHLTLFCPAAPLLPRVTCGHKPHAAHNPQRFDGCRRRLLLRPRFLGGRFVLR